LTVGVGDADVDELGKVDEVGLDDGEVARVGEDVFGIDDADVLGVAEVPAESDMTEIVPLP